MICEEDPAVGLQVPQVDRVDGVKVVYRLLQVDQVNILVQLTFMQQVQVEIQPLVTIN